MYGGFFVVYGLFAFCIRLFWGGGGGVCNLSPPCIYFFPFAILHFSVTPF